MAQVLISTWVAYKTQKRVEESLSGPIASEHMVGG